MNVSELVSDSLSFYLSLSFFLKMTLQNKSIVNPYASKRPSLSNTKDKIVSSSSNGTTTSNATHKVVPVLPPTSSSSSSSLKKDIHPSMSFSQVFAHVEHDPSSSEAASLSIMNRHDTITTSSSTNSHPNHNRMENNSINHDWASNNSNSNNNNNIPTILQPHVLLVSKKQRGNPILQYVRNVPFAYTDIVPDYILGSNRCALFLSLKYHNLYPNYIHGRIAELKSDYDLRIILCLIDVDDNASLLLFLNKLCCVNHMTLLLAWSEEEAARYLETIKTFEHKEATLIQKKKEVTFQEQVAVSLGCVRSVTKTDASQLLSSFTTLRQVLNASMEELRLVPGIGDKKVKRLYDAFHKPFSSVMAKKRKLEQHERQREQETEIPWKDENSVETETAIATITESITETKTE